MVKDILAKSQTDGKKNRLRTLKDLDADALQLAIACKVLLNSTTEDIQVREEVWQRLTPEELSAAITDVEDIARPPEDNYYDELLKQWRSVRRFLPKLLSIIDFEGNQAGQNILEAWQFLQSIEGKRNPLMDAAPLKIVDKKWAVWVVDENGKIDRRAYTFCVRGQLLEGLRRRDLFVSSGERWSNPRAKLLKGQELSDEPQDGEIPEVTEIDELQTFVGCKKNKLWIWTVVNHWNQGILLWTIGDRSDQTFARIWQIIKCWHSFWYVTDGWKVYPMYIQSEDHLVSKTYMTRVEGENTLTQTLFSQVTA